MHLPLRMERYVRLNSKSPNLTKVVYMKMLRSTWILASVKWRLAAIYRETERASRNTLSDRFRVRLRVRWYLCRRIIEIVESSECPQWYSIVSEQVSKLKTRKIRTGEVPSQLFLPHNLLFFHWIFHPFLIFFESFRFSFFFPLHTLPNPFFTRSSAFSMSIPL